MVVNIKLKHATASTLVKRLIYYSQQHRLYLALLERIVKPYFLLNIYLNHYLNLSHL
ncbi:Tn3 family transposase [Dyadobacter sp. CY347]|uniref:Tn3 family transposase n=1 Tax=Dyadobacter sp. CY347 TaxID=2909336 RepID=UPI0038D48C83